MKEGKLSEGKGKGKCQDRKLMNKEKGKQKNERIERKNGDR